MRLSAFTLPISVNILMVVMSVIVPLSAALFGVGWYAVNSLQTANIDLKIARAQEGLAQLFFGEIQSIAALQRQLAAPGEYVDVPRGFDDETVGRWRELMSLIEQFPSLTAAYAGYQDGSFIQATLLARRSPDRRQTIDPPPGATRALWLISFNHGDRQEYWIFFDDAGNMIEQRAIKDGDYDPRSRPWYRAATQLQRQTMTAPYEFTGRGGIGITAAVPLPYGTGVLAADFSLNSLSTLLRRYKVSPSARMKVMTSAGEVLADSIRDAARASATASTPELEQEIQAAMIGVLRNSSSDAANGKAERLNIGGESNFVLARALPPAIDKDLYLTIAIPAKEFTAETDALIRKAATLALAAIAAAIVIVVVASRIVGGTLRQLAEQTQRFQRLDFSDTTMVRSSVSEISRLSSAVGRMRAALELFGRYIPKQVVRRLLESDEAGRVGGVRRDVTVMFTDIQGFSAISESIEPEVLMSRLSDYFNRVASAIIASGGTVDKYIGDGIMSVWNALDADPDHVANACRGALAILDASRELAEEWQRQGVPPFHTRIGIHCGIGVVGNVGSVDRMNYTLIGSVVNLAARLEGINKVYGTRVLASAAVREATHEGFVWRQIDRVIPSGTSEICDIFELIAERSIDEAGELARRPDRALAAWDMALAKYMAGEFSDARSAFDRLFAECPDDTASRVMSERCVALSQKGPPPNWDGVTRLGEK